MPSLPAGTGRVFQTTSPRGRGKSLAEVQRGPVDGEGSEDGMDGEA